ncbi:unnamed protein product [Caenorhabditis auriculariae]|uniref:Uncharacterized protein n=1 Tax=Caenorhabditis auriculariae TaxID=2777116 RepID=A0A8S1H1G1_9PELO|nr:unnamed protein product [Caenorhabditis auriculariae]
MKHYKWVLLSYQTCITIMDIVIPIMLTPLFYLPAVAGCSMGWFQTIGVPIVIQLVMGGFVLLSIQFTIQSGHMSAKTRQLQKTYFFNLCGQVCKSRMGLVILFYLEAVPKIIVIVVSLHGGVSSTFMIIANKSYRSFLSRFRDYFLKNPSLIGLTVHKPVADRNSALRNFHKNVVSQ